LSKNELNGRREWQIVLLPCLCAAQILLKSVLFAADGYITQAHARAVGLSWTVAIAVALMPSVLIIAYGLALLRRREVLATNDRSVTLLCILFAAVWLIVHGYLMMKSYQQFHNPILIWWFYWL
jgi:hypothetical protein